MVNKFVGAAAIAAIGCAFVPVHAARVGMGCSGENLANVEGTTDTMSDGPAKFTAQQEIAQAQDAMLNNDMRGCAVHLMRAKRAETSAAVPYPAPYSGSWAQMPAPDAMAQAPAEAGSVAAPSQPQWNWKPVQSAQ